MSAMPAVRPLPPATPSPVPSCVDYDRSGGYRARVTWPALRRFGERVWHVDTDLTEGLTDREAVDLYRHLGLPVDTAREWLAYYGYAGPRYGAAGAVVRWIGLRLRGETVVTVVTKDWDPD